MSRWTVAPFARGTAVGPTLVLGAWAVGRWLGKLSLLATVGTRDGQKTLLARFGGHMLQNAGAKYVAEYDDEVVAMHFDLTCPPPRVAAKLDSTGKLLGLVGGSDGITVSSELLPQERRTFPQPHSR